MTDLLRRALALVPDDARGESGASAADVRAHLDRDEWEFALDLLGEFGGIDWQPWQYWALLVRAAEQLHLPSHWFRWREYETYQRVVLRAVLRTAPGEDLITHDNVLWLHWDLGTSSGQSSRVWVEPKLEPECGDNAMVRLLPTWPQAWHHLTPGDMITLHEGQPVTGTATVIEYAGVGETRQRDR
ncbi:hypothetical protein [Lentzea sp. NEAU-D7]|uniref:hypothetical protein n=1 Tax=Lentzea sp. NEAU-D7 TaxID=2994667 RepID=UPI00224B48B6|nr:hypothetical protein [Lentzea sp. NEAU-D7]MCX2953160.1 hypothetical protein [Lentzea sp. NEAU-D7]